MSKKIVGCVMGCNQPIATAAVMAVDCNGRMLDKCTTDEAGQFELVSSVSNDETFIVITAPGYEQVMCEGSVFDDGGAVELSNGNNLPAKLSVDAAKIKKYFPLILTGAGVLGCYVGDKQLQKRGARVGKVNYTPIILLGGVGVLGYLAYKYLPGWLQGGQSKNNDATTNANANAAAADKAANDAAGITQTISNSSAASAANTIYSTATATWATPLAQSDQDTIMWALLNNVNNAADLTAIITAFGTKSVGDNWYSICFSLGFGCDAVGLGQFLRLALDTDHINEINSYLSSMGINTQF